ncbi:Cmx/CmrA family chloramphenicol efflux MFS transporter [Lysinibacter cavernae]|uniref:DHA1 family chloramphenicol resistance protein-like MFS transporter n=1 Tax=Lysinibacter cavernae TaxID=1640652 RepID=A0A7X5QZ22_9MICO|nr:Cmx/CmrA family chloramphenicol efflux MFS transporter [Lysinibacter cavernae]NIH52497.1 DHA1 family chloramphenicol resistance protein-like MFS transporter [Lysinibacter cavernae]
MARARTAPARVSAATLPAAVWIIGFAIFAQGTSELVIAGLLPELASDLTVTVSQAGLLVSAFALGMFVGAPILSIVTLRMPRRQSMLLFLAVFIVAHIVAATADSYQVLFLTRLIGAFVYAGFWAVGAGTALQLVPAGSRGRAMSVVAGGLTVALVVGVPAGTWLGQAFGWRSVFWAIAGLSAVAWFAVFAAVPRFATTAPPRIAAEMRGLRVPRLWLSYAMTSTSIAALIGVFSFLGVILVEVAGFASAVVPWLLLVYGVGALVGTLLGGRLADRLAVGVLAVGFGCLLIVFVLFALLGTMQAVVIALVLLLGVAGAMTNPALNARVVTIAPAAPTLAVAGSVSAFNLGIALGPWLNGSLLDTGSGYVSLIWVGASLAGVALALLCLEWRLQNRHTRWRREGQLLNV